MEKYHDDDDVDDGGASLGTNNKKAFQLYYIREKNMANIDAYLYARL